MRQLDPECSLCLGLGSHFYGTELPVLWYLIQRQDITAHISQAGSISALKQMNVGACGRRPVQKVQGDQQWLSTLL